MGRALESAPGHPRLKRAAQSDPRAAAHDVLRAVGEGAFADRAAERAFAALRGRDRALALRLAYGCIRLRARLDAWIRAHTDRPLSRIDPPLLDWLRIGFYELTELRVPDHAAVNETVARVRRRIGIGPSRFANAVLRAAAASGREPFPDPHDDPVGHLTTWGSHPEWLIRRWLDRWGRQAVLRLVAHDNEPPPVVVRLLDGAVGAGERPELWPIPGWPRSFELREGTPAEALADLRAVVQDPAASAVVDYVGDAPEPPVYDACAAPGTKAMGLAARGAGPLVAGDASRWRVRDVAESASRLGLAMGVVAADARNPPLRRAATVLADVPCTGTGVLRRRPDARWRIDARRMEELVRLQAEILEACAEVVDEGGLLVYSTCSLEEEENEMQVAEFLGRHPEFERDPPSEGAVPARCVTREGDLLVLPWVTGTDGAYAARLRRTG